MTNMMKPKTRYLLLCILGLVLPYSQFLPWAARNGLNMPLFLHQLFSNQIGGFFAMDVLVSAIAFLIFVGVEGSRLGMRGWSRWLPLISVLTVGVSLGLPLFLYLRECKLQQIPSSARSV
jgi:hypothetical protein